MQHLYFIRHGETDFNARGIVQGSGIDSDLNERGRAQAQAFYEHYQHVGFELVYVSKLRRTAQTVAPFIAAGVPYLERAELNEIGWGENEGALPNRQMTEAFNTVTTQWRAGNYDASVVDGESAASLLTRVEVFLQELKTRPENRILIATHGRTLRAITCLLHGLPISEMERFNHRNTSLVEAAYNRENNTYQVLRENDTMHLGTLKLTV